MVQVIKQPPSIVNLDVQDNSVLTATIQIFDTNGKKNLIIDLIFIGNGIMGKIPSVNFVTIYFISKINHLFRSM